MVESIILRNLSKRYASNGVWALREVSLTLREGEILSLLGPNGAGKTTLIAILCGLFPPTEGEAIVAGRDVIRDPLGVKQRVGVVPEEVALYPQLSARRNLRYFGRLYGLGGRELSQAVEETLALVGLAGRGDEKIARYSGGMKRRLNIAVALLHRPRVLLMDEPTLGLDPESRRRILDLVLQLRKERAVTILYTTHEMDEAEEISDRVGIMHQGRIVALGTPDELLRAAQLSHVVELHLGAGQVSSAMLETFRRLPGVEEVMLAGETIRLTVSLNEEALSSILHLLLHGDGHLSPVNVRSLTIVKPKLEAVFLQLTGQVFEQTP